MSPELERLTAAMRRRGLDFVLLTSPPNVTYAAGLEAPLPVGFVADITRARPTVVIVAAEGSGAVLIDDANAGRARAQSWFADVRTFATIDHEQPADPRGSFVDALSALLRDTDIPSSYAAVGVEATLPGIAADLLAGLTLHDATDTVEASRRIKTPREIELLRRALAAADAGQRRLLELSRAAALPVADTVLWSEAVGAMELHTGRALAVSGSIQAGRATADFTATGPTGTLAQAGDAVLLDIGPRVDGYWADCANTVILGRQPTPDEERYLRATRDACLAGIDALRPGHICREVWGVVRDTFARHGFPMAHYAGHQIGTSVNERPRLLPFDDTAIEAGMVFAVEAGAYEGPGGSFGARSEKVALVTESGPEILSTFAWELS